jgi:hypothetical protein
MKYSFHRLIPFLPLFCCCKFRRFVSIHLLPSLCRGRLTSGNSTQFLLTELFFITTLHGPRRKYSLCIDEKVCLQRRCIATEVTRLLLASSLPRQYFYRAVAQQWTSILTSLLRLSGVISQYNDIMTQTDCKGDYTEENHEKCRRNSWSPVRVLNSRPPIM